MRLGVSVLSVAVLGAVVFFASPSSSLPPAETYAIDPYHSTVIFRISHLGASNFYGRFNGIKGDFTVAEGGTGSVSVTIDVGSVDTANEKRDAHLKSPDFFAAEQFPEITFRSDALKHVEGSKYEAKGMLTIHGVSKEITVAVDRIGPVDTKMGYRTGFEGVVTLKRSDFGMKNMLDAVGDEVRLILAVEGVRK